MQYYRGGSIHPKHEFEQSQHRYKYHVKPDYEGQLPKQNVGSRIPHEGSTEPLPVMEHVASKEPLLVEDVTPRGTQPLPASENAAPIDEEVGSLGFYIKRIVLGAWRPFKDTPPKKRYVCLVLFILVQIILSFIIWSLMASLMFIMNLVYLILAIPASYIVLEEWMRMKKQQKDEQEHQQ